MTAPKFPRRVRGYCDGGPYNFCSEQWEEAPFKHPVPSDGDIEFISAPEVEALLRSAKAEAFEEMSRDIASMVFTESNISRISDFFHRKAQSLRADTTHKVFGMEVKADPNLKPDQWQLRDPDTKKVLFDSERAEKEWE